MHVCNLYIYKIIEFFSSMDPEDESTAYLKYLNDPTTSNNYLLSNEVELADSFPFAEIESADWPSESFPVLLNSPLITEGNTSLITVLFCSE